MVLTASPSRTNHEPAVPTTTSAPANTASSTSSSRRTVCSAGASGSPVTTATPVSSRALSARYRPSGADSGPHTVSLSAPLGRYRALSARLDTGVAVVTGLPLAPAEQTVRRLLLVELAVFAGALVVVGTAGSWLVRLGLRPLDQPRAGRA